MKKNDNESFDFKLSEEEPTIKFFLLGIEKEQKDSYPVYVRLIYKRQKTEISIKKIKAKAAEWDFDNGLFLPLKKHQIYCNGQLTSERIRLLTIFHDLVQAQGITSVKTIRRVYRGQNILTPKIGLLEFFDMQVEEKRARPLEYTPNALEQYTRTRTHLKRFLDTKGWENIKLSELSRKFIVQFDNYLMSTPMVNYGRPMLRSSADTCIKRLITIKNDAIKKELLDKDPFIGFHLKKAKNNQIVYLVQSEIQAIKDLDYSQNVCLSRVRDIFLSSVYTGLRYSDLVSLRPGNLSKDATGRTWLYVQQHKTKELLEVPLVESAIEILDRYSGTIKQTGYLLPRMSNQKLNVYLKGIAIAAGIGKRVTMHVGRHTFATMALETLDLKTVSKLLGHASVKSTEIYAKITKQKLSSAIALLNAANAGTLPVHVLN